MPHRAMLTVPANAPRKAARHATTAWVFDPVFFVRGKMASTLGWRLLERSCPLCARTMTIVRYFNGRVEPELAIFNTPQPNDWTFELLEDLVKVRNVVRFGAFMVSMMHFLSISLMQSIGSLRAWLMRRGFRLHQKNNPIQYNAWRTAYCWYQVF